MDDQRQEAQDGVRFRVWSGGDAADEIFEIACDEVFDGECAEEDEAWLRRAIAAEFAKKPKE